MKLGFLGPRRGREPGLLHRLTGGRFRAPWVKLPWTFAVASGKGGTGKSLVTANLATQLCVDGCQAGIFDADLGVANAHLLLGVHATRNVAQVLAGRASLGECVLASPFGPRIVPGGSGISDLASLSAHEILRLAEGFRGLEEGMDVLLLDCAAGISVQTILFVLAADDIVVVTNPDFTAMTDAYALIKVVHQRNEEARIHLVVNRCREPDQAEDVHQRLQEVCIRFLGRRITFLGGIAEDEAVRRSVGQRRPFVVGAPESEAAGDLRSLRAKLMALPPPVDRDEWGRRPEGFGDRLASLLRH